MKKQTVGYFSYIYQTMSIITYYKLFLKILQIFSFLPISYNLQRNYFKRSILIQIYSITTLSIFCFLSHHSIIKAHLLSMTYCNKNCINVYISTGTWIFSVTPLYFLLYQSIFNINRLVQLANEFLSFYKMFEWSSSQWNMVLIFFTITEFVLLPITSWIFLKLLYDSPDSLSLYYTIIYISLPLLTASTTTYCLPIRYCSYFIKFLNNRLIDEIITIIYSNNSNENFGALDRIILLLLKIQKLIPNISEICAPVLCITLIIIANNLSWTYFHMISSFVLQRETKIIIVFVFVVFTESLNSIKFFWLIIFPCASLKKEITKTVIMISNINCRYNLMMTMALRRKVSTIF